MVALVENKAPTGRSGICIYRRIFLATLVLAAVTTFFSSSQLPYYEVLVQRISNVAYVVSTGVLTGTSNALTVDLTVLNSMGAPWTTLDMLKVLVHTANDPILTRMQRSHDKIISAKEPATKPPLKSSGPRIVLAGVSCWFRRWQFLTMIKSAVLFSQDASLHLIIFSDKDTIRDVGQDVLELKWSVNSLGWDFTYELHLVWFPNDGAQWELMYVPCATQRLFFPSLLPHVDALIYLDSDVLVMSNLTEMWLEFENDMKDEKMAAVAANTEPSATGWYRKGGSSRIPFYEGKGSQGLNAGVMLMNLTLMRAFDFQRRAKGAQLLYNEKIDLADQDIINIIFNAYPERLHQLDCSYNFNWVHCGDDGSLCHPPLTYCFCNATFETGVRILHGNGGTFAEDDSFLVDTYNRFEQFNILTDSRAKLIEDLREAFQRRERPCGPLTADMLFGNAQSYLALMDPTAFNVVSSGQSY